jgi:hypothetical protein
VAVPSRTLWRIATEVWRLDPRQVRYVPNGIDLPRFAHEACAADGENLARLLRAFRLVVDVVPARLVIAGDGPERPGLERLTRDLRRVGRCASPGISTTPPRCIARWIYRAVVGRRADAIVGDRGDGGQSADRGDRGRGDVAAMLALESQAFVTPLEDAALAGAIGALARRIGAHRSGARAPGEGNGGVR